MLQTGKVIDFSKELDIANLPTPKPSQSPKYLSLVQNKQINVGTELIKY